MLSLLPTNLIWQVPKPDTWHLLLDASSSMSELRLWAEETSQHRAKVIHQSNVSCEMFWSSSSRRKVAHIDKCCQTWRAIWAAWVRNWGMCVRDEVCSLCGAFSIILWHQRIITLKFNQLHLEVGWCFFHIKCEGITKQFKPTFLGIKVGKSPAKLKTKFTEFFTKLCEWEHGGRDLHFYCLAAG